LDVVPADVRNGADASLRQVVEEAECGRSIRIRTLQHCDAVRQYPDPEGVLGDRLSVADAGQQPARPLYLLEVSVKGATSAIRAVTCDDPGWHDRRSWR
jgi:hypothetical protein